MEGGYYRQPENRVCGVCDVEVRKVLLQEPAELIKAIGIGWVHHRLGRACWALCTHPSFLSIMDSVTKPSFCHKRETG